jgi:hypothetical protein
VPDNRGVVIGREIFFSRPYCRIAHQPVVKRPDRSSLVPLCLGELPIQIEVQFQDVNSCLAQKS